MAPFGDAARLEALVQACLQGAEARGAIQAAAFLRANAARVEQRLRALSAWADGKSPGGADEQGLSAFELADAMDRLNAAARRRERDAACGCT